MLLLHLCPQQLCNLKLDCKTNKAALGCVNSDDTVRSLCFLKSSSSGDL